MKKTGEQWYQTLQKTPGGDKLCPSYWISIRELPGNIKNISLELGAEAVCLARR